MEASEPQTSKSLEIVSMKTFSLISGRLSVVDERNPRIFCKMVGSGKCLTKRNLLVNRKMAFVFLARNSSPRMQATPTGIKVAGTPAKISPEGEYVRVCLKAK